MSEKGKCRFCGAPLHAVFADLGMSPPSNAFLDERRLAAMEKYYPLKAYVCDRCWLVQLEEFETPSEIFSDYVYFSSYSSTWLEHCRLYVEQARTRLQLGERHRVVEIASNDGYLLQYFKAAGVPVLGVEPAANVARAAIEKGIATEVAFFGTETATRLREGGRSADLIVANNVLAHVPEINDFLRGVRLLLNPDGTATFEFPHLLRLMQYNQFDTIYHEHFSYLSATVVRRMFEAHGLRVVDIEELPTHGGSLRIWAACDDDPRPASPSVDAMLHDERESGLESLAAYADFQRRVIETKAQLLSFLIDAQSEGKTVAAYGAAAKGNTLLNYCGIRSDLIDYVVDKNPNKQGKYLPGSHLPVYSPDRLASAKPDYVLILPWNLRDEIAEEMKHVRAWGARFVVPIPHVEVF